MLRTLTINNIALISFAEIDFSQGLNILTGETGAGKSIIIDSLNFVLGERADRSLIREGEEEAVVEAEFDNINQITQAILKEYEIDFDDGLILSRKMGMRRWQKCLPYKWNKSYSQCAKKHSIIFGGYLWSARKCSAVEQR